MKLLLQMLSWILVACSACFMGVASLLMIAWGTHFFNITIPFIEIGITQGHESQAKLISEVATLGLAVCEWLRKQTNKRIKILVEGDPETLYLRPLQGQEEDLVDEEDDEYEDEDEEDMDSEELA